MKKIFIYGIGGAGRSVLRLIYDINQHKKEWEVIGFVCNSSKMSGGKIDGYSVYKFDEISKNENIYGICGMMDCEIKKDIVNSQIKKNKHIIPTLIHPTVTIKSDCKLGKGVIIFQRAAFGYNTIVGENVWIDAHVLIGHEVIVGSYTSIMPSSTIGGDSKIGRSCLIGSGTTIHPEITIGNNSLVGIGTTIIKNISENTSIMNFPRNVERKI
jgi:sugar O-acyltransferase (sialic acid O-acetyltransferase NeuD family)